MIRRNLGLPLVILGVLVLGATPLYWQNVPQCPPGQASCVMFGRTSLSVLRTTGLAPSSPFTSGWAAIYWLCAIPVGFAVTAWRNGPRYGGPARPGRQWAPFVFSCALLGALIVTSPQVEPRAWFRAGLTLDRGGDLTVRGLMGLLVIAVGLVLLAILERSLSFGLFVAGFMGLALVACLYDLSNVISFGGMSGAQALPNVVLPGLALLVGGVMFRVWPGTDRPASAAVA